MHNLSKSRGALFGSLRGSVRSVLGRFSTVLPNKHGRGGQSANRFARQAQEARHNYVRKVAETASSLFLGDAGEARVAGLVLAGSADLKTVLGQSGLFDRRLRDKIVKYVDVAYGGNAGFNQAIELSKDCLGNVQILREKELLAAYFDALAGKDDGRTTVCYGERDTRFALEAGAAKTIVCWDELRMWIADEEDGGGRWTKKEEGEKEGSSAGGASKKPLLDWLVENYSKLGAERLELVSDRSAEGKQFVQGFGGIGAFLR